MADGQDDSGVTIFPVRTTSGGVDTRAATNEVCLIETTQAAVHGDAFRRVLYMDRRRGLQIVSMSVPAGGDIGAEVHPRTDQLFLVPHGANVTEDDDYSDGDGAPFGDRQLFVTDEVARAELGGPRRRDVHRLMLDGGDMLVVPAGTRHNIRVPRSAPEPFRFLAIYVGQVLHADDEVDAHKSDAED